MRVVVVGATGNVGTSLLDALASEDGVSSILGICRRPPRERRAKASFVAADVASSELVHHFRGADAVVHLAWLFQPTHSPLLTWRANAVGSIRVFAAAAEAGITTLVYASSVGAYSPGGKDQFVDESWPTHSVPTAAYGREKAYVERALDAFEARHPDVRVVRLRPSFIFKRTAASEQRRLFAGPLLPGFVARPGRLPLLPHPPGLRFQALHSADAAEAYRLALVGDVRGAFNLAAGPVIDAAVLADVFGARQLSLPRPLVRAAVAAAWHLHLAPADPTLLDLVLQLPLLDTTRARDELGWEPRFSGVEALREMLEGMADGAGGRTPPLAPDSAGRRLHEVSTGVGEGA
ncbi:MAG: NAD-dependent epimerase/dehydratase family protein [Actinomycetota bacterium]|nr:NAD-dependent epimerase/dehydratase family protein [Actinomycetota bacterium]